MKVQVIIHKAEEGGFWAEVPALKGCFTQAETYEELIPNIHEAIELFMTVDIADIELKPDDNILELAI